MKINNKTEKYSERLDYKLLKLSPIILYKKNSILERDARWLKNNNYKVYTFNTSEWKGEEDFHKDISSQLGFPKYYGNNMNAFNDCLSDYEIPIGGGVALVFKRFNAFSEMYREFAWNILDIIACHSRGAMLDGKRLLTLIQSDDPQISISAIGGVAVHWNPREWLIKNRLD